LFLLDNYNIINKSVIFLAVLLGVYSYQKFKLTQVKYFIWFLVYVFVIEVFSGYYSFFSFFDIEDLITGTIIERNYWWITLTWVIGAPLFYSYYFKNILSNTLLKQIVSFAFWSILVVSGLVLIVDYRIVFSSYAMPIELTSFAVVIVSIACYFVEVLLSKKVLVFYKSINFYISVIVLFWWLVTTPLLFFEEYFNTNDPKYITLKWMVYMFANILMYSGFALALYFCKPQKNEYIS
jgi:hypothetical protein